MSLISFFFQEMSRLQAAMPTILSTFQAASRHFRQFHRFRESIPPRRILLLVQHRLPMRTRRILTSSRLIPLEGLHQQRPTPLTAIMWSRHPHKQTLSQSTKWRMVRPGLLHPQADFVVANPSPPKVALLPRSMLKFRAPHRAILPAASICLLGSTDNAMRSPHLSPPPPNAVTRQKLGSSEIAAIALAQVVIRLTLVDPLGIFTTLLV